MAIVTVPLLFMVRIHSTPRSVEGVMSNKLCNDDNCEQWSKYPRSTSTLSAIAAFVTKKLVACQAILVPPATS